MSAINFKKGSMSRNEGRRRAAVIGVQSNAMIFSFIVCLPPLWMEVYTHRRALCKSDHDKLTFGPNRKRMLRSLSNSLRSSVVTTRIRS